MKIKNELIKGSLILFIFMNLFNFLNYAFHFFMARMLNIIDYGVLAVLMSLVYVFLVPSEAIQLVASKYSTMFNNELGKIKYLFSSMLKKSFRFGLLAYILFIPIAFFLSWFLDIKISLLLFIGVLLFFAFLAPINRGILQGQKKFNKMGISILSEAVFKIIIALFLVIVGWKIYGAIAGIVLGLGLSFIFSFIFIKDILNKKQKKVDIKGKYAYSFRVFFVLLILFIMLMIDMIFIKRFFSGEIVGAYAVISLLGKTIFFATVPISKAMFPFTSNSKKHSKRRLVSAIKLVSIIGILAIIIFLFFSKLIVLLLFGETYLEFSNMLWLSGIAFLMLALSNVSIHYWLSLKKVRKIGIFLIFPIIQIILLYLLNKNIMEFIIALIMSFSILFLVNLLMIKHEKG